MNAASAGAASPQLLVLAKAPVPGLVKTRLAADLGDDVLAAEIAAASLLDTLAACVAATGPAHCRLALAGDLGQAVRGDEIRRALHRWTVTAQVPGTLGERLAAAHAETAGPVVQIGMDTPQATPELLLTVAAGLAEDDAVLAPATDGGWWALALRDGRAAAPLAGVPMSTPTTCADTRSALTAVGLVVGTGPVLADVDHLGDAYDVAALVPGSGFARAVLDLRPHRVPVGSMRR